MDEPTIIELIQPHIKHEFGSAYAGLESELALILYDNVVKPFRRDHGIVDAHTHFSARQIVENEAMPDIFTAMVLERNPKWPNRDHYIAQLLASQGKSFEYWYGTASPKQKWMEMAKVFPKLAGTEVYKWTHRELNEILGVKGLINEENAQRMWREANKKLKDAKYRPRALLADANVKVLATTDDPLDDLPSKKPLVIGRMSIIPTYRPDKAMNIEAEGWVDYVDALCDKVGEDRTLDGLCRALKERHDDFAKAGCTASDHGLCEPFGYNVGLKDARDAFKRVYTSGEASDDDIRIFKSFLMHKFARWDRQKGWATQIHFGALRNQNEHLLELIGPDAGGDFGQANMDIATPLHDLLNEYAATGDPNKDGKIVLYSLSPSHYAQMVQMAAAFPSVSLGESWWFNDNKQGMKSYHEIMYPTLAYTRNAGMVCDGRKPLSMWARHDNRDRLMCNEMAHQLMYGEFPKELAQQTMEDLMYNNQVRIYKLKKAISRAA